MPHKACLENCVSDGPFRLVKRRKNRDGTFTDVWALDPVTIIKPSSTNKAYKYSISEALNPISNPSVASEEFSQTEYFYISNDDGYNVVVGASANTPNRYANTAVRFIFDLSRYSGITQIVYRFDGYRGVSCDLYAAKAMHKTTSGWVDGGIVPATDYPGWDVQVGLTDIGSVVINGFFEFGVIVVGVYQTKSGSATLYADAAEIEVTYTALIVPVSDSGVGEDSVLLMRCATVEDGGQGAETAISGLGQICLDAAESYDVALQRTVIIAVDGGLGVDETFKPFLYMIFCDDGVGIEETVKKDITLIMLSYKFIDTLIRLSPFTFAVTLVKSVQKTLKRL